VNQHLPEKESLKIKNLTRRQVLIGLGSLSLLGVTLSTVRGAVRFLTPPVSRTASALIVAGPPEIFPEKLTPLKEGPAFIGRDAGGLFALSAVCTHLGCTVALTGDELTCPCHASRFASDGANLAGPASRPLAYLQLELNAAGLVEVNLAKTVSPSFRLEV
jgi:cytochrome b6-f complex iron-sulfur subunit